MQLSGRAANKPQGGEKMAARKGSVSSSSPAPLPSPSLAASATFEGDADDLATLSRLDEQVLVDQLHRRYDADKIYVSFMSEGHAFD